MLALRSTSSWSEANRAIRCVEDGMRYDCTGSGRLLGVAGFALASLLGVSANAETYEGAPVKIGNGEAKTVVSTDAGNKTTAISIVFTPGMLTGLPQPDHDMGDVPFSLAMPTTGPKTIVDHVVINWEAMAIRRRRFTTCRISTFTFTW
jgi:TctA family transporter